MLQMPSPLIGIRWLGWQFHLLAQIIDRCLILFQASKIEVNTQGGPSSIRSIDLRTLSFTNTSQIV